MGFGDGDGDGGRRGDVGGFGFVKGERGRGEREVFCLSFLFRVRGMGFDSGIGSVASLLEGVPSLFSGKGGKDQGVRS